MATEDNFDGLTEFLPSADLIEQWQTEPESRPDGLTVDAVLQWLADLYADQTDLAAALNTARDCNASLRKKVDELGEDIRRKESTIKEWQIWADQRLKLEAARKPKKEAECSLTALI